MPSDTKQFILAGPAGKVGPRRLRNYAETLRFSSRDANEDNNPEEPHKQRKKRWSKNQHHEEMEGLKKILICMKGQLESKDRELVELRGRCGEQEAKINEMREELDRKGEFLIM